MSALEAINTRRALLSIRRDIEKTLFGAWDEQTETILREQAEEAVGALTSSFRKKGVDITVNASWMPSRADVEYGRYRHRIYLRDDDGHERLIRQEFRSRRLARVWQKRRVNWAYMFIMDMTYRDPRPIECIKLEFTANRTSA